MELMKILWINRRKLLIFNSVIFILALTYSILLPKWYRSSALILIQSEKKDFNLSTALSQMMPFGMGLDMNLEVQKYIGFLESRTIADQVIDKFDLIKAFDVEFRDDVYRELAANVRFIDNDNGTITITSMFKSDPQKAADIGNYYFELLENLSLDISQKQAKLYRTMLEEKCNERRNNVERIHREFASFKVNTGVVDLYEQTRLAVNAVSDLETEKMKLQFQLEYLNRTASVNNPQTLQLRDQIELYQQQIKEIKDTTIYSNVALNKIPQQSIDYFRYSVDINIENRILEFLTLQLEQARLDETKIVSNLYLLDKAQPAERKFKPKRSMIVITFVFFSILFSFLYFRLKKNVLDFFSKMKQYDRL